MPTSVDLVTDLPADFAVFGQAVATSMADLLGGASGYVLSKASATDMDFTWIPNDQGDITGVTAGTGITGGGTSGTVTVTNDMATTITTNGDLIYGTGSGTYTRRAIGSTSQVLTVAGGVPTWATPAASGGMTLISTTTLSGATVTLGSFSGYTDLQLLIIGAYGSNANSFFARFNGDSSSLYYESTNTVGTGSPVATKGTIGDGLSNTGSYTLRNFTLIKIQKYAGSELKPYQVNSSYIYQANTAIQYQQITNNLYASATAITSIDLFLASGNFSAGTAYLYGVK